MLEQYKKGVKQKIFSREIRFRDENGKDYPDLEDLKFEQLNSYIPTSSLSREYLNYDAGSVKNIHYGDFQTKFSTLQYSKTEPVAPFGNLSLKRSGTLLMSCNHIISGVFPFILVTTFSPLLTTTHTGINSALFLTIFLILSVGAAPIC